MKNKVFKLIPFGIACFLVLKHVLEILTQKTIIGENGEVTTYRILDSVLYALVGLLITLALVILKRKVWKWLFLGLVILTFTPFVHFYNVRFYFNFFGLDIDLAALGLLILHLSLNSEMIPTIKWALGSEQKSVEKDNEVRTQQIEQRIHEFEKRFETKTAKELQQIADDKDSLHEAKEAAKRVLSRK